MRPEPWRLVHTTCVRRRMVAWKKHFSVGDEENMFTEWIQGILIRASGSVDFTEWTGHVGLQVVSLVSSLCETFTPQVTDDDKWEFLCGFCFSVAKRMWSARGSSLSFSNYPGLSFSKIMNDWIKFSCLSSLMTRGTLVMWDKSPKRASTLLWLPSPYQWESQDTAGWAWPFLCDCWHWHDIVPCHNSRVLLQYTF